MRRGIYTTEWWLTLATNVGALTATLAEAIPPRWGAALLAVSNAAYAISRGWAKSSNP